MKRTSPSQHEAALRAAIQELPADLAQEIREDYYKAIEGLYGLSETLSKIDGDHIEAEASIAQIAVNALRRSKLGAIL